MMAKWLERASQWHETYCHDLEVMSLNPGLVELGLRNTSVALDPKISIANAPVYLRAYVFEITSDKWVGTFLRNSSVCH